MDCILDGAVAIVRGDRETVSVGNRDSVRRRATTRKLMRRYVLRRKIASRYRTLTVDG